MKILQVNTVISYGSTGIICQNIARGLIANGHDCLTVYGRGNDVEDIPTKKIGNKFEQGLHYLRSHFLDQHGLGSRFATRQLIQIIRDYQPDVIHLHNIHGYYVNYRILFEELRALAIPVVWLLHDQWAISGGSATSLEIIDNIYEIPKTATRSKGERRQYPSLSRFSINHYYHNINYKNKYFTSLSQLTLVTPSKWLGDIVKKSFLSEIPLITIYNGVNTNAFVEKTEETNERITILGVANAWSNDKGLGYFCRLSKDLGDKYRIILVGLDDKISTPAKIIRVGKIDNKELLKYYQKADVFVNPTLRDNFPTVNIEAQLCGTPVITFDTGGAKEAICTQTGKIVVQGDYEQLFVTITSMIPKNKYIATKTREHALAFSVENMVNDYIKLYQEVVVCKL
ncbi:glycosyltransferase [Streptococcus suis]|uniref:Glycosyltransferase n=1 Tax=Streptococcus suis TaxID=1307 RepID=A0A1P8VR25_STRSU|nr:Glycosyltransferase [Streptococcus suis]HEM2780875.1 glycosyltransferase [Streptococcus suis]